MIYLRENKVVFVYPQARTVLLYRAEFYLPSQIGMTKAGVIEGGLYRGDAGLEAHLRWAGGHSPLKEHKHVYTYR